MSCTLPNELTKLLVPLVPVPITTHIPLCKVIHGRSYLEGKEKQVNICKGGIQRLGIGMIAEVWVSQQWTEGGQFSMHSLRH